MTAERDRLAQPRIGGRFAHLPDNVRFWGKVRVGPKDACWEWQGARLRDGYGQFWTEGHIVRAHRWAFEWYGGVVPPGLSVLHACDNPPCVNPAHLYAGTIAQNSADMWDRGRPGGTAAAAARQTHCIHGHPFDEANTMLDGRRHRQCRACARERKRRYEARKAGRA